MGGNAKQTTHTANAEKQGMLGSIRMSPLSQPSYGDNGAPAIQLLVLQKVVVDFRGLRVNKVARGDLISF